MADALDLGSSGATHGGSSPPSRTNSQSFLVFNQGYEMRIFFTIIATVVLSGIVFFQPSMATAQYYGYYYYPQVPQGPPGVYYGGARRPTPPNPYQYYLAPNPRLWRQWDRQNRLDDYQWMIRSPNNPESSLDYMLRTF